MNRPYVVELTAGQRLAHERIKALQTVYDAAREVSRAYEILDQYSDDPKQHDRFTEAMSNLEAAIWNTAGILKEPYPYGD